MLKSKIKNLSAKLSFLDIEKTRELEEMYERTNKDYSEMKADLLQAKIIQDNILPKNINSIEGLNFQIEFLPLIEIGGDIYDVYKHENGAVRIFIADTTGHGIVASLITMLIKNEYDKLKTSEKKPFEILEILNNIFINRYISLSMFFTSIIIDLYLKDKKIVYANAGSPTQFLIRNSEIMELKSTGRPIGMFEEINCRNKELDLNENDRLLLFTDGIFEEFNQHNEEFGEQRVKDIIYDNLNEPLADIIDAIFEQMIDFIDEAPFNDDITLIGIEYKNPD